MTCMVCGGILNGYEKFSSPSLLRCLSCGMLFAQQRPSRVELEQLYTRDYFKSGDYQKPGYLDYQYDEMLIKKSFARRLKVIMRFVASGKLLDVGCATGFCLEVAQELGLEPYGVELSSFAASCAQERFGTHVFCGELPQADFPQEWFDVITAWDYIEHVPDPVEAIQHMHALLRTGGILALTTPDASSIVAKLTGARWLGFKEQEHLCYFSRENLAFLLKRIGFSVVSLGTTGKYVDGALIIDRLGHYNALLGRLGQRLLPSTIKKASFYVNPFDIVFVIAKKINN